MKLQLKIKAMRKHILSIIITIILNFSFAYANVDIQPNGALNYYAVLVNGSVADKYDIVFVGDGFTAAQQDLFNQKVEEAVNAMRNRSPYKEFMCSFNIWRVNVLSEESGCDHPLQNSFKNTELNCTYGNNAPGNPERLITTSTPWLCYEAGDYAPGRQAVYVLVNDMQWGGGSGSIVTSCIGAGFEGIITHELGHFVGGLADEYDYGYSGCYPGGEPSQVNVTIQTNSSLIKWKDLILPGTPIPTTVDNPPGVVGLWEGGKYYTCNIYRPQFTCHMKTTGSEFCAVCKRELQRILAQTCTFCDRFPGICAILHKQFVAICKYPLKWPFPGCPRCPVCLTCPFELGDIKSQVILEGVNPRNYTLEVLNSEGKVIAAGQPLKENGIQATFEQNNKVQYFLRLSPVQKDVDLMQAEVLNISVSVFQNGKETMLY